MKLEQKRNVIEVLLSCAQNPDEVWVFTTDRCAQEIGMGLDVMDAASDAWIDGFRDSYAPHRTHGDVCLEAAYRLIESSATLRREWFGAS